jgi:hypothetical protein
MPNVSLSAGASGNTGVLASDSLFFPASGVVYLSTDNTAFIPFSNNEKVIISAGLTVYYKNTSIYPVELRYFAI